MFFIIILSLTGCGGGGGGGDSTAPTPPPNIAPVANAGPDQTETLSFPDTAIITLTGTSSDSDGTIAAHQWVQTEGAAVTISGAATPTATFTVSATTEAYSFSYTVTDDDGAQQTDTVSVYVTEIIYSDLFDDGPGWISRWTIENGDTTNWSVPAVPGGQLLQISDINTFQESYHEGTYAVLNQSFMNSLSDYRFSADITPSTNLIAGSRQGNDVGIMFRYVNDDNYYRVSMNARFGFTRFEKRIGGNFETLAVNAIGYVENQAMNMTVEVKGNTILVWIDGDPVFAAVDSNIPSGTVALYCQDRSQFDNVFITENSLQPKVVIATPLAYSVALTQNSGDTLPTQAVVLNAPSGGSVAFTLDSGGETIATASGNVYSAQFTEVTDGEHEIMAILKYAGDEVVDYDINSTVGTGGDYYVTLGDSITNGQGDENPFNNDSADGRIVAIQSFQSKLADDLTTATGRPQIVFNEGINGDGAEDLLSTRINSILLRHPGANRVLLLIGTNDASMGTSNAIFQNSVNSIAGIVLSSGVEQIWLAQLPPYYTATGELNTTPNDRVQAYNQILRNITETPTTDNIFPGPDFYNTYLNQYPTLIFGLHPTDAGYQVMADEWHDTLTAP